MLIKKIIKLILFLFIFAFIWNHIFRILGLIKNPIGYFYDEPRNSLDVVYVGSSNANTSFNTVLAYNLYGFTTGMLSTESQSFINVKYLIKESEKYQKPKLYIVDIAKLADDFRYLEDGCRKTLDSMKFSLNRIDAINELLYNADIPKSEYIGYYFNFLLYHNHWKTVNIVNFKNQENSWDIYYKGYLFNKITSEIEPQQEFVWSDESFTLQDNNKPILLDLIKYIKDNNLNVLFVLPNREYWYPQLQMLNDAMSIIRENGLEVINFNALDEFKLNPATDLYNQSHINVYGSTKYTLYFSKYLKEAYNLDDHRNDDLYISWEKDYERFKADFKSITKQDFDKVLEEYKPYYDNANFSNIRKDSLESSITIDDAHFKW